MCNRSSEIGTAARVTFAPQGQFLELPELDMERLHVVWQEAVFALYLAQFTQHIPPKDAHLIRYYIPEIDLAQVSRQIGR